jgi:Zn-finger nucleic acid-binding protein
MTYDAHRTEDEWFAQHERDLIEDLKRERIRREQEVADVFKKEETQKQKELHWMKCPQCGSELYLQHVHGIAIDVCQICDGIHFDRSEIENLLLKPQKERRLIVSWILPFPGDLEQLGPDVVFADLQRWREHKMKELHWLLNQGEAITRKDLHWMKCPKCGTAMTEEVSHGVSAWNCSLCLGTFIERLQLQKLFLKQKEERKNTLFRMLENFKRI